MPATPASVAAPPVRIGAVSFLNTLPLTFGLERLAEVSFRHSVPSLLLDALLGDEVDLALCSSIDHQRAASPLVIVPAGLLGCDGPTLTVRLFARAPIEHIDRVYCDTDSHTSVVLLRIILDSMHGRRPQIAPYHARERVADHRPLEWPEAMLLIGDKVVTAAPPADAYPVQMDLGERWRELTGLPFVFAAWMARRDADPDRLRRAGRVLDRQRRRNRERIDAIVRAHAVPRGWPADIARAYLAEHLRFEWTDRMVEALETFHAKAHALGLTDARRELEWLAL